MLSFVKVKDIYDYDAIVAGTYSQLYGGNNVKKYCLYKIQNEKIVDKMSWFDEDQLTLIDENNRNQAEWMIEEYNFS